MITAMAKSRPAAVSAITARIPARRRPIMPQTTYIAPATPTINRTSCFIRDRPSILTARPSLMAPLRTRDTGQASFPGISSPPRRSSCGRRAIPRRARERTRPSAPSAHVVPSQNKIRLYEVLRRDTPPSNEKLCSRSSTSRRIHMRLPDGESPVECGYDPQGPADDGGRGDG